MELTSKDPLHPHTVMGPGSIFIEGDQLKFKMYAESQLPRRERTVGAGELVPEAHCWRFDGTDMMGRTWICEIVHPDHNVSYCVQPPGVIVTGYLWQLEGRYDKPQYRELRVKIDIPGSFDIPLRGSTEVVSINETTGIESRQSRRDTASFQATTCNIVVEKRDSHVRFTVSADEWLQNAETRLCEAFCFVAAQPAWWEALYFAGPEDEYVKIRPRQKSPMPPRLKPPLNDQWSNDYWKLFAKYFDFVREGDPDSWHAISAFLDDVCEASGGSFSLFGLVVAVAIEGILKLTQPALEAIQSEYSDAADCLIKHVDGWKSFTGEPDWTKSKLSAYDSLKKRVSGMLPQLKTQRAIDQLLLFEKRGLIESKLTKNWQFLRNSSAHGKTAVGLPVQGDLDRIDNATALLYAIIFDAIGYEGAYTDYSTRGWPKSVFPPKPP